MINRSRWLTTAKSERDCCCQEWGVLGCRTVEFRQLPHHPIWNSTEYKEYHHQKHNATSMRSLVAVYISLSSMNQLRTCESFRYCTTSIRCSPSELSIEDWTPKLAYLESAYHEVSLRLQHITMTHFWENAYTKISIAESSFLLVLGHEHVPSPERLVHACCEMPHLLH